MAQELAHNSQLAQEMAKEASRKAQEARDKEAKEKAVAAAQAKKEREALHNARMERTIQEGLAASRAEGMKGGPPHHGPPHHTMPPASVSSGGSVQQQPLNLADSDSRASSSSSERSSGKPPPFMPGNPPAGFLERERREGGGSKGPESRPTPEASPHLPPSSAFVPTGAGGPREGLPPVYGTADLPFPPPPGFGMPRMPLDPRLYPGQQHPHPPPPHQFLRGAEGMIPFQQFPGQRFPLDQPPHPELLKKGELPPPPGPMLPLGRSPSPIPSPSPRLPPDMVAHPMMRDIPVRENLHAVLGVCSVFILSSVFPFSCSLSFKFLHFMTSTLFFPY
jgi:hypothetical protein